MKPCDMIKYATSSGRGLADDRAAFQQPFQKFVQTINYDPTPTGLRLSGVHTRYPGALYISQLPP
jgi:hypothetical protein